MPAHSEDHMPHKKMPEHHSTDKEPKNKEEKIDAQMADSFPASDPPSYSGGNHIIGAPAGRESDPAPSNTIESETEKTVKKPGTKKTN